MGLALRHKMKHQKLAAEKAAAEVENKPQTASASKQVSVTGSALTVPFEIQALKDGFDADLSIVQSLHGDEQRLPVKKDLIEKYQPLFDFYIQNFKNFAHLDVMFYLLLWRTDVLGITSEYLSWELAIERGLTSPERFKRNVQDFYLDSIVVYFDDCEKSGDFNGKFERSALESVISKIDTGEYGTNAPLKAKLFKRYGLFKMKGGELQDLEVAKKYFEKALGLDKGVGVKKLIKEIEGMESNGQGENK